MNVWKVFKERAFLWKKVVLEESGFPLEKEEQALKETSLKRGWIDAYRGMFLKKNRDKFFWKSRQSSFKIGKT